MSIYDELQGVATELFGEFGQGVIEYVAVTVGTGPVDDPGPSTLTATQIYGVARGVSFKYIGMTAADGSLVVTSDLQVTTPVRDDITPNMKDFIRIDGARYKIVQIINLPAAGTVTAIRYIVRS